ncbi:sister chromatid cohesion protein Eso1 [Sodiomyces alkalinus F11]|uniref:DNA polymerase eta n=1 Tax=Sodiomyces alkalinus (strain CBS 110278 / VKM F-3762 / F11) TaxID=1314773 RepID=A0A3N2Q4P7_SODAK|nr:sister chromatid cohesion protein Eso1 [Sodiomyces alkalinus F11]ROT41638.1 sister chromatid cohesion protein Eso1 [Sodiomyces alkalinus F11]
MSSPQFPESSPVTDTSSRKSQFTYRHLCQLASFAPSCPLRVVAHIDLDAFYAQCEMVRLGIPEDQPLAVQQWQNLIAVNYPARGFGVGRHCTITDAKKLCPNLVAQHVATWREGDDKWAYREDAAANVASDKVSLDPYRLQSRKILQLIKETLPSNLQRVEKASIDEVFCDLSAQVHSILLERFPELRSPPPHGDLTGRLPRPPVVALNWMADALVDLDEHAESQDPDWDDVAILIGSEIIRDVRGQIREELRYACSAGIANNKLLSKLGSAYKKPNQQTVIRSRAIQHFLSDFKITKIRNFGGKFGDNVTSTFGVDTVRELLPVTLDQMKLKLGDDTGTWVYNTIRGVDHSEVSSRTQIKSMLSAKSFRPAIHTVEQATRWLRIFAADISSRLGEENRRRPRTINLHYRHDGQMKSRQAPIAQGKALNEQLLFDLSRTLLNQILSEGNVWPCMNLSLSVGGFEDSVVGNMGIGGFLVKGEEAQALRSSAKDPGFPILPGRQAAKRRRLDGAGEGIHRFFIRHNTTNDHNASETEDNAKGLEDLVPGDPVTGLRNGNEEKNEADGASSESSECSRCGASFDWPQSLQSHQDWHLAKDLHDEERGQSRATIHPPASARSKGPSGPAPSSKRAGRGGKMEHGQRKLTFGGS